MGLFNGLFGDGEEEKEKGINTTEGTDGYYTVDVANALDENGKSKMILLEPRAYSESYGIIDHLKNRNSVVVNLKRVTPTQAKRIVDVLNGSVYAIGGDIQKLGGGIFLCTPNNVNIQGKITDETAKDSKDADKDPEDVMW